MQSQSKPSSSDNWLLLGAGGLILYWLLKDNKTPTTAPITKAVIPDDEVGQTLVPSSMISTGLANTAGTGITQKEKEPALTLTSAGFVSTPALNSLANSVSANQPSGTSTAPESNLAPATAVSRQL